MFHADLNSLLVYAPESFAFSQAHFKISFISSTVLKFRADLNNYSTKRGSVTSRILYSEVREPKITFVVTIVLEIFQGGVISGESTFMYRNNSLPILSSGYNCFADFPRWGQEW